MAATLLVLVASEAEVRLAYPAWSMVPGGYIVRAARRMHRAPTAQGTLVRALGRDADTHDVTLLYAPSRAEGADWHVPIDELVALEGRRVEIAWGAAEIDGEYLLESVQVTYQEMVYGLDAGAALGGWAAREARVRLLLHGGLDPDITLEAIDDEP